MATRAGADTDNLGALMIIACARGKTLTSHVSGAGSQPVLWVNKTGRRFAGEDVAMSFADCGQHHRQAARGHRLRHHRYRHRPGTSWRTARTSAWATSFAYHLKLTGLQAELDQDVADGIAWKGDTHRRAGQGHRAGLRGAGRDGGGLQRRLRQGPGHRVLQAGQVPAPGPAGPLLRDQHGAAACSSPTAASASTAISRSPTRTTEAIPGLYAVGNEASGLYGDTYNLDVPGTANGFAHASGRMAARHIAETLKGASA